MRSDVPTVTAARLLTSSRAARPGAGSRPRPAHLRAAQPTAARAPGGVSRPPRRTRPRPLQPGGGAAPGRTGAAPRRRQRLLGRPSPSPPPRRGFSTPDRRLLAGTLGRLASLPGAGRAARPQQGGGLRSLHRRLHPVPRSRCSTDSPCPRGQARSTGTAQRERPRGMPLPSAAVRDRALQGWSLA